MLPITVCSLLATLVQPPAKSPEPTPQDRLFDMHVAWLPVGKPDELGAILANHPDVQIAEAKLRIAQAELAKVKQVLAQQVTTARVRLDGAKAALAAAEADVKRLQGPNATANGVTQLEVERADAAAAVAKAAVAAAEAELKTFTGGPQPANWAVLTSDTRVQFAPQPVEALAYQSNRAAPSPVADKLRELLDKPVTLDLPADAKLAAVCNTLSAALAPSGLSLRAPVLGPADEAVTAGAPLQGQRPLALWLEVVADTFSNRTVAVTTAETTTAGRGGQTQRSVSYMDLGRREFFVRDYGLLFTDAQRAPTGAVPLATFLRQPKVEPPAKDRK